MISIAAEHAEHRKSQAHVEHSHITIHVQSEQWEHCVVYQSCICFLQSPSPLRNSSNYTCAEYRTIHWQVLQENYLRISVPSAIIIKNKSFSICGWYHPKGGGWYHSRNM